MEKKIQSKPDSVIIVQLTQFLLLLLFENVS